MRNASMESIQWVWEILSLQHHDVVDLNGKTNFCLCVKEFNST